MPRLLSKRGNTLPITLSGIASNLQEKGLCISKGKLFLSTIYKKAALSIDT
jgi:hypothetical protein